MTGYEFCCWLEGVLEMNSEGLTAEQIAKITLKMKSVKSPEQFAAEMAKAKPTGGSAPSTPVMRC